MIAEFAGWWLGQLAELLPPSLRSPTLADEEVVLVRPIEPLALLRTVDLARRHKRETVSLGRFTVGEPELAALPRIPRLPLVLSLTEKDVLQKTVNLPLAAQASLDQALTFEMDRETPFTADELYWTHSIEAVDRQRGQISVRLLMIPKARLERLLTVLGEAGLQPRWAEIGDGSTLRFIPLSGDGAPRRGARRLIRPLAACLGALALAAAAIPFILQEISISALDDDIAAQRATAAEAVNLRHEIDRLTDSSELIKGELGKAGRPLEVLAAVTRLLPDDTYLTEFEMRQRKLTLSGRSGGAARLIGLLAADGALRNPAFTAPVTRVEALHAEVFSIAAELGPPL